MGARAGATTKLRMGGSFIRIALCCGGATRRASYASPPHFPGGTVTRGTPTRYNLGQFMLRRAKALTTAYSHMMVSAKLAGTKRCAGNIVVQHALQEDQ